MTCSMNIVWSVRNEYHIAGNNTTWGHVVLWFSKHREHPLFVGKLHYSKIIICILKEKMNCSQGNLGIRAHSNIQCTKRKSRWYYYVTLSSLFLLSNIVGINMKSAYFSNIFKFRPLRSSVLAFRTARISLKWVRLRWNFTRKEEENVARGQIKAVGRFWHYQDLLRLIRNSIAF